MVSGRTRHVLLPILTFAVVCSCGTDEPPSVWDDLSGTIYVLPSYPGPPFSVDPVTGQRDSVPTSVGESTVLAAAPNGSFLVLGLGDLVRVDLPGLAVSPLVVDPFVSGHAAVSASSTFIAYRNLEPLGSVLKYRRIGTTNDVIFLGPDPQEFWLSFSWSGDSLIVFVRDTAGGGGVPRVWSANISSGTVALKPIGADTGLIASGVRVSPDGQHIAMLSLPPNVDPSFDSYTLGLATIDGRYERDIVRIDAGNDLLAWSPDGRYLVVCTRDPGPTVDLLLVHVATGQTRLLRNDEFADCFPAWVP